MLNSLLVLGLVPGTDFQITFSELMIFCLALTLAFYSRHRYLASQTPSYLPALMYSELAIQKPVAQLTPHKALILQVDNALVWLYRSLRQARLALQNKY